MRQTKSKVCVAALAALAGWCATATEAGATSAPPHVAWADRMVAELQVPTPDNSYGEPTEVTWAGVDGASKTFNRSRCAPFITSVLRRAYGWTDAHMTATFGSTSPSSSLYYDLVAGDEAGDLHAVTRVEALRPGDLLIMKYPADPNGPQSDSGHVMMVRSIPTPITKAPVFEHTTQFAVDVIDSSKNAHGADDTRHYDNGTSQGAGRGTARLYADAAGNLAGYTWSVNGSDFYGQGDRPIIGAHLSGPWDGDDGGDPPGAGEPPVQPPGGEAGALPRTRIEAPKWKRRSLTVKVRCVGTSGRCRGTFRPRVVRRSKRVRLPVTSFDVAAGSSKRIRIRVARAKRARVRTLVRRGARLAGTVNMLDAQGGIARKQRVRLRMR